MVLPRVYLAGPDVFLPDAAAVAKSKRRLCESYGFAGISPVDHELDVSGLSKHEAALRIAAANEEAIRNSDLVVANLTPFRGPSADPGTAYELGFARAFGLPVFAYTNVAGSLLDRMRRQLGARIKRRPSGRLEDADHMAIEDFDAFDNLMLVGAVDGGGSPVIVTPVPPDRRYSDLTGFEACLRLAALQPGLGERAPRPRVRKV